VEGQEDCSADFHTLLGWEFERQLLDVHHLLVLCYHLQHPSLYSPTGLGWAKRLLVRFVEEGITPQAMRQEMGQAADSGRRAFKIKGTDEAYGAYARPIAWTLTVGDVVRGGVEGYYANVQIWAESILQALDASGNS